MRGLGYLVFRDPQHFQNVKEIKDDFDEGIEKGGVYEGDGSEFNFDLDIYFVQKKLKSCVERVLLLS